MTNATPNQEQLDRILARGIVFSIVWVAGFGSLYAFLCGVRARRMIQASGGSLLGRRRAWWCLIVGALGMLVWFPIFAVGIYNNLH
jgi:hypothetical protein